MGKYQLVAGYDLKEEFNQQEEIYKKNEQNAIKRFLRYRCTKKNFDCDRANINQITGIVYRDVWLNGVDDNLMCIEGDTLNSFWTTFKKSIILSFQNYFVKEDKEYASDEIKLKYEFVLVFGGLSRSSYPMYQLDSMYELKKKFNHLSNEQINHSNIEHFLKTLLFHKNYSDDIYKQERFQWIYDHLEQIEEIMIYVNGKTFYNELHEFAKLYHNIGNMIIQMKGYNCGRALPTLDYLDLTLESFYHVLGEEGFKLYIERYFLEDYVDDFGKPIKFWKEHSFQQKEVEHLSQIYEFLLIVNKNIKNREQKILQAFYSC